MLTAQILASVLQACAPTVSESTQSALIQVESGGNAFALLDNNTGKSAYPHNYRDAVIITEHLTALNHQRYGPHDRGVDVGITQINSLNFSAYGLQPALALDPCVNLRVGSFMLTSFYTRRMHALAQQIPSLQQRQQLALTQALQMYNSGKPTGDQSYVARIILAAYASYDAKPEVTQPHQPHRISPVLYIRHSIIRPYRAEVHLTPHR